MKSVLLGLMLLAAVATSQVKIVPGSATRGERLLTDKGCTDCHALNGTGANRAPDLGRTPPHAATPSLLAGAMWNHASEMWAPAGRPASIAPLTSAEAADVFAYLYSVLYFATPGDAPRGKVVFQKKYCADCHHEQATAKAAGPAISTWAPVSDPIIWAERMWNHSPQMDTAGLRKGFQWPELSSQDIADLLMYFRSIPALRIKSYTFGMGEPEQGRVTFERTCESCHSFGTALGKKIDLLARPAPTVVTGYIASMWNHALIMQARSGFRFPKLGAGEMPNLVAFLFSQSYFFERGNERRGRSVFEKKACGGCHEDRRIETRAPDLTQAFELYSPITLTSSVWRHGPSMFMTMRRNGKEWPRFEGSEMADLIAYLNSRVTVRLAPK